MKAMKTITTMILATVFAGPTARSADGAAALVVIPFGFFDTSGEPRDQKADHAARLATMSEELSAKLRASGLYRIVAAPADAPPCPAGDTACLLGRAKSAGADIILTGAVQKVSTMASDVWVGAFDAMTGRRVFYRQLTFRGDTDDAWHHATSFLFHQIEADPPKTP